MRHQTGSAESQALLPAPPDDDAVMRPAAAPADLAEVLADAGRQLTLALLLVALVDLTLLAAGVAPPH